jgi:hypothetical protein
MDAVGLIGIGLWVVIGVGGVWMLITGRKIVFGLPRDYREGWPVRAFGLAELLLGIFVGVESYRVIRGAPPSNVVLSYGLPVFAAILLLLLIWGRPKKANRTQASPPQA